MNGLEGFLESYWWIIPLALMLLCLLCMRGRGRALGCFGSRTFSGHHIDPSDSPGEILDKRYALGDIGREEYEEKKRDITQKSG